MSLRRTMHQPRPHRRLARFMNAKNLARRKFTMTLRPRKRLPRPRRHQVFPPLRLRLHQTSPRSQHPPSSSPAQMVGGKTRLSIMTCPIRSASLSLGRCMTPLEMVRLKASMRLRTTCRNGRRCPASATNPSHATWPCTFRLLTRSAEKKRTRQRRP